LLKSLFPFSFQNSRSPAKTPIEQTSNYPCQPSSLEASTGSGYFYDDDFSTQLGGNYAAIDMDTFENEDISSFFAVYSNHASENKMVLVRTRSDSALYNYELELSMSERTSSRGQSSSGYDCASSAELSFRSDQVYSPGMTHSSLQSGPLFSSSQDGVVPQNLYSTDSLDRTDLDCSIAIEDDFNLKACYANKENYVLAFDRSPTKYSDDEQEYHDAWLSDATENLDVGDNDEEDTHTDSEYMCSEMDHSAGEMVYLDDYYSNEHEPLLAEHMLLSAEHENILPDGAAGAAADQNWNESADEEISEEFNSDDTHVVPEDYGYRSASDQDDSAINILDVQEDSIVIQENLDESADNTIDDYDSQLLDEIEQELQMSADVSESFAYDNLTFEEDASVHASVENGACGAEGGDSMGMDVFQAVRLRHMAASDSAQLISPDYEMMYSYPEGLSEVLAGRMNGGRLLKRWRNIQQNLHDLSSSEPITLSDPTDSIEPRAALHPFGTVTLNGGAPNEVSKPMICWGQKFGGKLEVPGRKEKEFHSSDSTLENISWTSRENSASELETPSISTAPKSLTTWQQVKKARTPQTSWKKIKEMKQFLRDEELLASNSSKCKSAPNLAQECDSASERDDVASICYRPKREKQEDVENKRHSFTLFEIFRRSKSEDQEYGKLPSPIYQKLYGSLMATDGYFLNHLEGLQNSFTSDQQSVGINKSQLWTLDNEMETGIQHSRSSSINKINSCVATPGSSSNSCGCSPSSEANIMPPPYSHHSIDMHAGPVLDDENLQAHNADNARSNGLMQHVSLLPIIQANFNCTESAIQPTEHVMTTFGNQDKPQSLKRDLAEMLHDEQPNINNGFKHRLIDQVLTESGGKFVDSITSFSGDTISKPVYTTSSPNVFCRAVQTSVTITQAGKVAQECQTSFDKTLCDEHFPSVEKSNSGQQATPTLEVGNSPTSQSQSQSSPYSQGSCGSKNRSQSAQRLDCADEYFTDDTHSPKDKLSRSLMFMNTRLPDLSFLNPRGMSKSSVQAEQQRKPQRSKSYDCSQSRQKERKQRYFVKPKQKIVVIEDEQTNSSSLTDAEALAAEMQQVKTANVPVVATNPRMVLMNNEQFDNGSSTDSVSRGTTTRKIEIVRNGEKSKFSNKMTNLEKDKLDQQKSLPENRNRELPGYYANMSSTTSSAMDISSDSQASHNNGVLNSPRMSRRDMHGQVNHHNRCSSRSHDYHSPHSNHYDSHHSDLFDSHHGNHLGHHNNHFDNHHSNHCGYHNICHSCYMEKLHAMHHGSHCGMHHCSPHPDNRRNHSMTSPDGFVYYSDDDHHPRRSNRGYNTHRADCLRRSSTDTDNSSRDSETSNMVCDDPDRNSDQSGENQASCNESDTSSIDGRHLKPIIKQRKRRPLSAPSGIDTHSQNKSPDCSSESTTTSEKSSGQGSDHEALSDDGAPTVWSADDHSVVRGNGNQRNKKKTSNIDTTDNRVQEETCRRIYSVNLRNEYRHRHSYSQCCPPPYRQMRPCCMPPNCFHGCGHMMCCCHGNSFCCGDYNSRLRRNKKSVSFSEEIKYHSPYSSPHCSPKKQQKPPLLQDNGRVQAEDRKERNRIIANEKAKTGSLI
jgi:hypothetical protein